MTDGDRHSAEPRDGQRSGAGSLQLGEIAFHQPYELIRASYGSFANDETSLYWQRRAAGAYNDMGIAAKEMALFEEIVGAVHAP